MSRERRVTFRLSAEYFKQLQALATMMGLNADVVAMMAVEQKVSKCMREIQVPGRVFNHYQVPDEEKKEIDNDDDKDLPAMELFDQDGDGGGHIS